MSTSKTARKLTPRKISGRILIADDKPPELLRVTKTLLEQLNPGWQVFEAESASIGKEILRDQFRRKKPIDVLLTDLKMENADAGFDLLKDAKNLDEAVVAILITGYGDDNTRELAFQLGAFDYLEKPVPPKILALKLRAALHYKDSLRRVHFLRRYFDSKVFEAIQGDPSLLEMQKRMITICFWDIRGFSRLCVDLQAHPNLIAGFLREYSEIGSTAVFSHGGVVDKFIGDGVMALFGALSNKDEMGKSDALDAVKAALQFKSEFEILARQWEDKFQLHTPNAISIGLGCGIHSGEALVGSVETEFRDQFTALGPHVNFASRLESRAESGQILISQSTAARVRTDIALIPSGEISDIKNVAGTFKLFSVSAGMREGLLAIQDKSQ